MKLSKIQRSISHRAPLQEVLAAITDGASELLGDEIAGLRLLDPTDPGYVVLVSVTGVKDELVPALRRGPIGEGAGGRAISEGKLVIIHDYDSQESSIPALAEDHLKAAMAAPVFVNGEIAGSLVVASYREGRTYSKLEQEGLLAFAEHASLALTDAQTVEAMRDAQKAKELFFAMASHELKTPLTVILGTLRTLERHGDHLAPDIRAEMIKAASDRGEELEALINRLLRSARSELAGDPQVVELKELISEPLKGFDSSRSLSLAPIPDLSIVIDKQAVHDIVGILLENAISHSAEGSEVHIEVEVLDEDLAIHVRNPGSLPRDINPNQLFMPFAQGGGDSGGVGLGLYIATRTAMAMGGRIDVDEGDGFVTFSLRVQMHRSNQPQRT